VGQAVLATAALALAGGCALRGPAPAGEGPELSEWYSRADVLELRAAMDAGQVDAETIVRAAIARIEALDDRGPRLRAVLDVAPGAIDEARARDAERRAGRPLGPLHGIPVLIKGNIDVAGLPNTAGSLALAGNVPTADAPVVASLREAGAVILGTTNLSEWANFRSSRSSSGWSSVGRQTRNPHVLDRNPCGSSSGSAVAVAAGFAPIAIGTETDGSIVCPAGQNGVVGIKPTHGLVSADGIVPIAHSQDTAGPIARTVWDAAIALTAIARRGPAPDTATGRDLPYTPASEARRLDGVRIGIWRDHYGGGQDPDVERCLTDALAALVELGAEIVDPIELGELDGLGEAEETVLYTEFRHDLARYLESHGRPNGLATLDDLIAWNDAHAHAVMPYFDQERFERAADAPSLDDAGYVEAVAASKRIARAAIDGALAEHELTAIVAPTNSPAWPIDLVNGDHYVLSSSQLPAVSGYPNVTVPMCFVHELPVGMSLLGGDGTERDLLRVAGAFETATRARRAPAFRETLPLE
jgi:amidase